ncbi:MAG: glycoside hydrolase family 3 N-terminal domain-containing protein [Tractidigestivibacter sp.]|jgi:beta-glucosidase|uniref:glycoside hydrolase family 3 N-terminal domain-containing protein n=1 Tax=Tractidigestivibacter sp. TaxID=2847320 RepID=UPI003D8EAA4F
MRNASMTRRQLFGATGTLAAGAAATGLLATTTGCSSAGMTRTEVARPDAEQAKEAGYAVAAQIQDEGTVLLKNSGVLPLAKGSTVMPFGRAYLEPIYGQLTSGGSAKWSVNPVTPEQGLSDFTIDNAAVDVMRAAGDPEALEEAEGTSAAGAAGSLLGGDCRIYEYDPSIYDDVAENPDATGIVFVTRAGQEGQDQKMDAYSDGTPHYLALSENERGAIAAAKRICGAVVVVIVGSAPMEVADLMSGDLEVDGLIHYGHPSERGFSEFSALLDGEVNPSGRTVDTWSADFTADPSYVSVDLHTYDNLSITSESPTEGGTFMRTFNEYQEGMYMGYRYYETAALVDSSFSYDDAVVFPFGFGLSYTTFSQTLDSVSADDEYVTVRVTVTNTGSAAGKDVVQVYASSPYTELDQTEGIEKPACQLIDFAKTDLLQPGQSQTLELEFDREDLASYCYTHENPTGTTGCYVLEAGDYVVSLRENSHTVIDQATVTQDETFWFDGSDSEHIRRSERDAQSPLDDAGNPIEDTSIDYVAASNRFQASTDYMHAQSRILSRSDWAGTKPVYEETKSIDDEFAKDQDLFVTFDPQTDARFGNVEGSVVYAAEQPTSGAKNGLVVADLRGREYDDPMWDALLDEIDWDADRKCIIRNFSGDAYLTAPIDSIGLPGTVDMDGGNGLKVHGNDNGYDMTKSCSYGYEPLVASTWNKDLVYQLGHAIGTEGLAHGINGWYSPGLNLHRSLFSGRVFEYYSEDPVLTGKIAERVVSGAGDMGLYCYLKHFALNDTETGRSHLICTWCDEQTMRELYLRPFEIALKEARKTVRFTSDDAGTVSEKVMRAGTAVMATQTCIGTMIGHCNYALLHELLREEWGFKGMVISDYWVWNGDNHRDLALRAGCDTYLSMDMSVMWSISDYDSATARTCMRRAIHNLAFAVANSSAMQSIVPGAVQEQEESPWRVAVHGLDIVAAALVAGGIALIHRRSKKELEHPELYKRGKRAQKKLEKRLAKKGAKEQEDSEAKEG